MEYSLPASSMPDRLPHPRAPLPNLRGEDEAELTYLQGLVECTSPLPPAFFSPLTPHYSSLMDPHALQTRNLRPGTPHSSQEPLLFHHNSHHRRFLRFAL
jgi:hypothetical protein